MMRFLRNLFGNETKQIKRKSRRPSAGRRLGLEGLESRDLMAFGAAVVPQQLVSQPLQVVAPAAVTVSIQNNDLVIRGTDAHDDVKVTYLNGKYEVSVRTLVDDRVISSKSTWRVTGGDVFFYGNKGDDKFLASFSSGGYLHVTAEGGDGDDELTGSWGKDNLRGGNGRDMLIGQANDDKLDGGLGPDYLDGRDGNDTLICGNDYEANNAFGAAGNDTITGSYGDDSLNGGGGNDIISGNDGNDIIHGDDGNDTLNGDLGADEILGGNGHDLLDAGNDNLGNYLDGGTGNDHLYGSLGNDYMRGDKGNDWLYGGAGNDQLYGGIGDQDHLYGGTGNDTLGGDNLDFYSGQAGVDTFFVDYPGHYWPWSYDSPPTIEAEPGEQIFEGTY